VVEELDAEGIPIPTCAWHPDRRPIAACVHCGRTVCKECAVRAPEGYLCPECPPAADGGGTGRDLVAPADPVAAWARLLGLVGLVPLIGAPGALAAVGLAVAAHRRARKPSAARRSSAVVSLVLGLLGLAGTAAVMWLLWLR